MLKKDTSARLQHMRNTKTGEVYAHFTARLPRGRFVSVEYPDDVYQGWLRQGPNTIAKMWVDEVTGRTWWLFRGSIWVEDVGYSYQEVAALIIDKATSERRRAERAVARLRRGTQSAKGREPIPDDVKAFVWNRDNARCVKCGSKAKLEYDHIIPVSMGGSNTARNIQLLCERCNRAKGGSLV